jgi:hypothetical protein
VLGLAAAGISYASIPDGSGVIHSCYANSGGALKIIDSAKVSTCPTGTTGLNFNQKGRTGAQGLQGIQGLQGTQGLQGIQGPAGISEGISGTSGTSVPLNQAQTLTPVLSATGTAPVSGTYYVNASVMLVVAQGDTVACILSGSNGTTGAFATVGPVANQTYETLPLSEPVSLTAGATPQVLCSDYTANATTSFYDGGLTATLINSAAGNAANRPAAPRAAVLPPHLH